MTLGQAWRAARDRLVAAGVEGAALDARLLAERAFGLTRLALATNESQLADGQGLVALDELIDRRLAGEPVARLLGEKEFYGLAFVLNEATLVPRPETELLVDKALAVLEGRAGAHILDLGTGTGCIPIAILSNAPEITAVATDISERALAAARENAHRHGVADRIAFLLGPWFEALDPPSSVSAFGRSTFSHEGRRQGAQSSARSEAGRRCPTEGPFDLIVSNPPYIESEAIAGLAREVREHDPRLALDGGPDGLTPYRIIAKEAPRYLKPEGWLMVETGSNQGEAVAGLLEAAGFSQVSIDKDLAGLDRVVSGHHV